MPNLPKNTIITPMFRTMFHSLFEPSAAKGSDKLKYSVEALFEPKDIGPLEALAKQVEAEKWKSRPYDFKWPIREGEQKPYEEYQGKYFIRFSSNYRVRVVDQAKNSVLDPNRIYPGQFAYAVVTCAAFDKGGKGVAFYLNAYQIARDCEPIDLRADYSEYMAELPTDPIDPDEIPF